MTWTEKEVPSLELCRRLKELGYPQEGGGWYWAKIGESWILELQTEFKEVPAYASEYVKAPTCRELGEWLPIYLEEDIYLDIDHPSPDVWIVSYIKTTHPLQESIIAFDDNTEPNARAKMLIWLVENGYVEFKEGKGED